MNAHTNRTAVSLATVEQNSCDEHPRTKALATLDTRLIVAITSYRWGKHDPDGVSIKAVLDGLIRAGILRDDSTDQIQKICLRSLKAQKKDDEKTIIDIYTTGEKNGCWC